MPDMLLRMPLFLGAVVALTPAAVAWELQPYAGIGMGVFDLNMKHANPAYAHHHRTGGGYVRVGVDIGPYFGGEARIGTTVRGSATAANTAYIPLSSRQFYALLGKGQFEFKPGLRAYALLGVTTAKIQTSVPGAIALPAVINSTRTGATMGAGAEYILDGHSSASFEWVQYLTNVPAGNGFKASMWGAALTFTVMF
ncbi:MAG: porin family protein [Zetaproteobacteria bacterium]|nr:MAG: porin family protein [Zetaproteobacteria bacterium]